jgi:uncharacterized protein YegL
MTEAGIAVPVYMAVDVSYSLANDLHIFNSRLTDVVDDLRSATSHVGVFLSVISFSDDVVVEVELTDIRTLNNLPKLRVRSGTSYSPVLWELRGRIDSDVRSLKQDDWKVIRPSILFLTDGAPADPDWRGALAALKEPGWRLRPNIFAFGVGSADPEVLRELATGGGEAYISRAGWDVSQGIDQFPLLVQGISTSLTASVKGGQAGFTLAVPDVFVRVPTEDDWI